jgi:hypothetical protein
MREDHARRRTQIKHDESTPHLGIREVRFDDMGRTYQLSLPVPLQDD